MKRVMKRGVIVICLALGLLQSGTVSAAEEGGRKVPENSVQPNVFDISLGTELMSGDTTYSIGFPVVMADGSGSATGYFPFSELEWPLDSWLARVDAGVTIGSSWRVKGTLKKNISDPSDHMIDKDWITANNPGQLDVYSESHVSDFDALILDFDVEWIFEQRNSWSFYAGLGYQYQKIEYEGQAIHQYSPSGKSGSEFYGDGSVSITYGMIYQMVYALIGTEVQITPQFSMAGSFAYSPLVNAEDEDNHLLRDKVSKGDMDGDAYLIDVSATYDFLSSWFMEGGFHYTKIDVDGNQDQSFYGVPTYVVYEESESTQTSGYLNVGYRF